MEDNDKWLKCQYWQLTHTCKFWDFDNNECAYEPPDNEEVPIYPEAKPFCDFIGTLDVCSFFTIDTQEDQGEDIPVEPKYRCVLPAPRTHIGNYVTSTKWVFIKKDEDTGNLSIVFDNITGYDTNKNGFFCISNDEEGGRNYECSAYSSYVMGFGVISPDNLKVDEFSCFNITLPFKYKFLNIRARLSTCLWWKGNAKLFVLEQTKETPYKNILNIGVVTQKELDSTTKKFPEIEVISSIKEEDEDTEDTEYTEGCTCEGTEEFFKHTVENVPCNGAHDKCPNYTGVCWEYVINDLMLSGYKALAEQVLELRYYYKEANWDANYYSTIFTDKEINAWTGIQYKSYIKTTEAYIPTVSYQAYSVSLDFTAAYFGLNYAKKTLIESTEVISDDQEDSLPRGSEINFPTLIKELTPLFIDPIIKNKLIFYEGTFIFESNKDYSCSFLLYGSQHTYYYDTLCIDINEDNINELPSSIKELFNFADTNELYVSKTVIEGASDSCYPLNNFSNFQEDLELDIAFLRKYVKKDLYSNDLETDDKGFIFTIDAKYGKHTFLVLTKYNIDGNIYWGFNKLEVGLIYIGAFITQTGCYIEKKKDGIVDRLYDYRKAFFGQKTSITLYLQPFIDKLLNISPIAGKYMYNNYKHSDLLTNTLYSGYKSYYFKASFIIEYTGLVTLGPSTYVLVTIDEDLASDSLLITSIYKEIFINDSGDALHLRYDSGTSCIMQVVKKSLKDGLNDNQFIIKPKDPKQFRSICKGTTLHIKEIGFYVKISASEENLPEKPGWQIVAVPFEGSVLAPPDIKFNGNYIKVTNIRSTLNLTVPLLGVLGRTINMVGIKVVVWIKQPMVPDIEMQYKWTANFGLYKNHPVCVCCGPYFSTMYNTNLLSYYPECGDHEVFSTHGKMWYPYTQCATYSTYNMISNQIFGDVYTIKEIYQHVGDPATKENGHWNMRMEGPPENSFFTGVYCCSICTCACQCETFNIKKLEGSSAYFSGFARFRGDSGLSTLAAWYATGGGLPKFGNVLRPQLKSYRATDYVQYLYLNYKGIYNYATTWAWLPSMMTFSDVDYIKNIDQLYEDFRADKEVGLVNGLGTLLFKNIDNVSLNEVVDTDRYRFEEVFDTFRSIVNIAYPRSVKNMDGKNIPLPQYKTLFKNGNATPIQWAWREVYKDIVRGVEKDENSKVTVNKDSIIHLVVFDKPKYKFDKLNREHRLICDEGTHTIKFKAPTFEASTGEYTEGSWPSLSLDESLERCFDWSGNLDPEEAELAEGEQSKCPGSSLDEGYPALTVAPWHNMGLFDKEYVTTPDEAKALGRYIELNSELFGSSWSVYNRGILIKELILDSTYTIPYKREKVENDGSISEGALSGVFNNSKKYVTTTFDVKKAISKVKLTFSFGIELVRDTYVVYSIPDITVEDYAFLRGEFPTFMGVQEKTVTATFYIDTNYLVNRSTKFIVGLILNKPVTKDGRLIRPCSIKANSLFTYAYKLSSEVVYYDTIITDKIENINVIERKYKVSTTSFPEAPPHGINPKTWVLKSRYDGYELDTIWQRDKNGEVDGIPGSYGSHAYIHKTRSRFVFESKKDTEPIIADLRGMEVKQTKLYNQVLTKDTKTATCKGILYPGIEDLTERNNVIIGQYISNSVFYNNTIFKIGTVRKYPKMQAKGHQLMPGLPFHEHCSWGGRIGCGGDDTFLYSRYNIADGSSKASSYTGISIFYGGTKFMTQRLKIAKFLVSRMYVKYDVLNKGKIFEDSSRILIPAIPEYFPMPGLFSSNAWYYPTHRSNYLSNWPTILPGLWPRLGFIGDFE
jgi:hypothetical protein